MVLLSLSTQYLLQYVRIFKHSGLAFIWQKWFINSLLHKDIQHFWYTPSCSSGWTRKHAFMSIFVIGHQRIILTGVLPIVTRQIWGIWKLRPAYSPETPNQNRWCFVPCDLEIWWMTLENNRASLLCCFKLCATFHSHRWIQIGVTVRKRPIWVKFNDF